MKKIVLRSTLYNYRQLSKYALKSNVPVFINIYNLTSPVLSVYKNFKSWLLEKVFFNLNNGTREVIVVYKANELVGVCILKLGKSNKISTIFVKNGYRGKGIGSFLMEQAIQNLDSNLVITVRTYSNDVALLNLFSKYNFLCNKSTNNELIFKKELDN